MGLFDKFKEAGEIGKNYEWKLGIQPALVAVNDSYLHIKTGGKEVQIFYEDIQKVEKRVTAIEIKTITDKYILNPKKIRGGAELADNLYAQIIEKMNEHKAQQNTIPQEQNIPTPNDDTNTPSYCSSCGQKLEINQNFCPNCGTEVRKI